MFSSFFYSLFALIVRLDPTANPTGGGGGNVYDPNITPNGSFIPDLLTPFKNAAGFMMAIGFTIAIFVFIVGAIIWIAGRRSGSSSLGMTGSSLMIGAIVGFILITVGPKLLPWAGNLFSGIFG